MPTYENLTRKADDLLKRGDAAMKTNPAEGKRLLRKCRRLRLQALAVKPVVSPSNGRGRQAVD